MRTARWITTSLTLIAGTGLALTAAAQHLHGGGHGTHAGGHGGMGLSGIHQAMMHALQMVDLDESQQAEMEAVHERYQPMMEDMHETAMRLHEDLAQAVHADDFDERAIRAAAAEFAAQQEELFVNTAEAMFEIRNILTEEQLQEVHGLHERMQGAHGAHGGSALHGHRGGHGQGAGSGAVE